MTRRRTTVSLLTALLLCLADAALKDTGFSNPLYPVYGYIGSRNKEWDQSGSYSADAETEFDWPQAVAEGPACENLLYIADTQQHCIRTLNTKTNVFTVFAGRCGSAGNTDGNALSAQFNGPRGVAVSVRFEYLDSGLEVPPASEPQGCKYNTAEMRRLVHVYVADTDNHAVKKVVFFADDPAMSQVVTIAGAPDRQGLADGPGSTARLSLPLSVAVDWSQRVYFVDNGFRLRQITPDGYVKTMPGGACQQISSRLISSHLSLRRVRCHPDWLAEQTAEHIPVETIQVSSCTTHIAQCGPREHPLLSDVNSPNLVASTTPAPTTSTTAPPSDPWANEKFRPKYYAERIPPWIASKRPPAPWANDHA